MEISDLLSCGLFIHLVTRILKKNFSLISPKETGNDKSSYEHGGHIPFLSKQDTSENGESLKIMPVQRA